MVPDRLTLDFTATSQPTFNLELSTLNNDLAISVRNVSKIYPLYSDPQARLRQSLWYALPKFLRGSRTPEFYREFWALRNISFEVKRGEALGIIGRNGSGKSTLLQIIAGTLTPTAGEVQVNGRVAALLELGSGFNPEFTGRENVYLNGSILGFSREEMDNLFDEIAAFADIGQFMDQPVKHYSSGMFVRLAFAVQACVQPDVLIVDEALSVGDIFFQQKCHARMEDLMARNTAVIIVSHDMNAIRKYSKLAILLEHGESLFVGQPDDAVYRYYSQTEQERLLQVTSGSSSPDHTLNLDIKATPNSDDILEWPVQDAFLDLSKAVVLGDESIARCTGVALCNEHGLPCPVFRIGQTAYFYYEFEFFADIGVPIGGIDITNAVNLLVHGTNSLHYLTKVPQVIPKGGRVRFRQSLELSLAPGEYTFVVGLATINTNDYLSFIKQQFYDYPHQEVVTILRIMQAGRFLVQPQMHGMSVPFFGQTNLKGSCLVSVL